MALSPHAVSNPKVMVIGKDPVVNRTLTKLLELDEDISVLGQAPSIGTAPIGTMRPDVVILDEAGQPGQTLAAQDYLSQVAPATKLCVLDALRDMTVREVLHTIKHLSPSHPAPQQPSRHLQPVAQPSSDRDALAALSERELEVVRLVAEGLSNKEISSRLSLSDKTVKNHISHILAKMNLTARTQVAVYAIRAGLV